MAYDERGGPPVLGKGETWRTSFVVDSPAVQDGERVRLSMALQNAMDSMQDSAGWVRRVTGLGMDRFGEDEDYDPLMVGGGATDEMRRKVLRPRRSLPVLCGIMNEFGFRNVRPFRDLDSYDDRNYLAEAVAPNLIMKQGQPDSGKSGILGVRPLLLLASNVLQSGPWGLATRPLFRLVSGLTISRGKERDKYIVKVHNGLETERPGFIYAQNKVMKHMEEFGVVTNKVVVHTSKKVKARDGRVRYHHIRMLSYIRGLPVNEIEEPSKELLYNMGVFVANVGRALRRFDHEAVHRTHLWDMQQFMAIKDFIPHIGEQKHKNLVLRVLGGFQMTVLQNAENLPKQIIHNDMNDTNLLVIKQKGKLTFAVIDWGDMVQSWRVNEIACSMAYTMLNKDDPIDAALHVLQGYISKTALKDVEWTVLYWCIAARLATSCTMSAYSYSLDRSNKYLLHTAEPGWAALGTLLAMTPKQFLEKVKLRHQKHKEQMAAAKKRGGASGAKKASDIEMSAKNLTGNRRSFVRVSNLKPHEA